MRRDLAIAFSLANLCLVGIWASLLPFLYVSATLPIGAFPCAHDFGAALANIALLTVGFWIGARIARSRRRPYVLTAARWVLLAVLLVCLNQIRMHFNTYPERWWNALNPTYAPGVALAILIVVAELLRRRFVTVVRASVALLLIMFPFAVVTVAQGCWAVVTGEWCGITEATAAPLPVSSDRRVVWIVFDELEQRATFERRPSFLRLPQLDRLRAQAIYAPDVAPPGHDTEESMPGYISGQFVSKAFVAGRNELNVTFEGEGQGTRWGSDPDVFSKARGLGFNTGLAGWFLPYCSTIGRHLTRCSWRPCTTCGRRSGAYGRTLPESMRLQISELGPRYLRRRHIGVYRDTLADAIALARDESLGLVLLHLPIPHSPWIYDRVTHDFTLTHEPRDGYFDNLVLVDDTLKLLRDAMETQGVWERSAVVLTGDHGWRNPVSFNGIVDHRVPFLLKLPEQREPATFDRPFNAIAIHELTLALLRGEVHTTAEALAWLSRRTGSVKEPIPKTAS